MRIANLSGRAVLVGRRLALDIATASDGRFGPDPTGVYRDWAAVTEWGADLDIDTHPAAVTYEPAELGAPVPAPGQIFGIGLNYAEHAAEARMQLPDNPLVFTKFVSSLAGPQATVALSGDRVDWEAELVLVIGTGGRDIAESDGWAAVAGLTVGQDLSDRAVQSWGRPAQFSLGKSFAGYAPTGPWVVSLDEVRADHQLDALDIRCVLTDVDGRETELQNGNSRDMIFSVPAIVSRLSAIVELRPGDLVFTGTPPGVGMGRDPQVFLTAGQRLTTTIEGVGTIRQEFVS